MKKTNRLLSFIALIFCVTTFSCQKNSSTTLAGSSDDVYKSQIEQLLHAQFVPSSTLSKPNNAELTFNSYQEAYTFFKSLTSGVPFSHTDTLKLISSNTDLNILQPETTPVSHTYVGTASGSASGNSGVIGGTITVLYSITIAITWPGNSAPVITQNSPGPGSFAWSGTGTLTSGTPLFTPESTGHGLIAGLCQGVVTVMGTSISFTGQVSGGYTIVVPSNPNAPNVVTSITLAIS